MPVNGITIKVGQRWRNRDGTVDTVIGTFPNSSDLMMMNSHGEISRGTCSALREHAQLIVVPPTMSQEEYLNFLDGKTTIQASTASAAEDADGWITWTGDAEMPDGGPFEVKLRSGDVGPADGSMFRGSHMNHPGDVVAYRKVQAPAAQKEGEHTGLSVNYYKVHVEHPTTGPAPYDAECNDIIEALGMTFAEGNVFKAVWRIAAARKGLKKRGNNGVYDAEKIVFFGGRLIVQETT